MKKAIGLLEIKGIVRGIAAADAMLKTAAVELLQAGSVCPGKYLVLVGGKVAAVESALAVGEELAAEMLIDRFLLANAAETLFPALTGTTQVETRGALGLIETFSVAAALVAADTVVKAAGVELIEIRIARGMGGKAVVLFTGDVGAVTLAIQAGAREAAEEGTLAESRVLAAPHPDLWETLL